MSTRLVAALLGALLSLTVSASSALADRLVALSIGVSAYTDISPLASTVNDAQAVAKLLAEFGYDVHLVRDPTSDGIRVAVDEFVEAARSADVAIVYFSGHGKQVNGESYLAPADAGRNIDGFADHLAVSAIVARLEAVGVKIKIVIVDACRNNPYVDQAGRARSDAMATAVGAGERRILGPGVMISFASAAGELSGDSGLAYSDYTQALLAVLRGAEQRIELTELTRATRKLVLARAEASVGRRQTPFEVNSIAVPVLFERAANGRVREMNRPNRRQQVFAN